MQIIDFYIIKQEGYRYYFNLISVKQLSKSDKLQAKYFYSNLCGCFAWQPIPTFLHDVWIRKKFQIIHIRLHPRT